MVRAIILMECVQSILAEERERDIPILIGLWTGFRQPIDGSPLTFSAIDSIPFHLSLSIYVST